MPAKRPIGTPRTTRLRKLECECGNITYQSRARIARHGLLRCPCGMEMIPADAEDAALVLTPAQLELHPGVVEYRRAVSDVLHGQAPHAQRGRKVRPVDDVVAEKLERARRDRARSARLNALPQYASAVHSDPIPF